MANEEETNNNENKRLKKHFYLLLKIQKNYTNNKVIYLISDILKFLPFFVACHDWNINSKKGISFWIRKFTLIEIISTNHHLIFYYILIFIFFILTFILFVFYYYLFYKIGHKGNLYHEKKYLINYISYVSFYFYVFFIQYFISICCEIVVNKKSRKDTNKSIYYLGVGVSIILFLFSSSVNILLNSIFLHEITFTSKRSYIINNLSNLEFQDIFYSLSHAVLQLEFHIKLKYLIIIKMAYRGLFCIWYCFIYFRHNFYYYKFGIYFLYKTFESICFVSVLIEFIFLYDYGNDKDCLYLVNDSAIIATKIILEIFLGLLLSDIFFYVDDSKIKNQILNLSYKNQKSFNYLVMKFFVLMYHQDRPTFLREILNDLNLIISKNVHIPKCKKITNYEFNEELDCYYCYKYNSATYLQQMNHYINYISIKTEAEINCIKQQFPLLYFWIKNETQSFIQNNTFTDEKMIIPLFVIIVFNFIYEHNYFKCLYLIEKIKISQKFHKNYIRILQCEYFKYKIIKKYQENLKNKNGKIKNISVNEAIRDYKHKIVKSNSNYKCIDRLTHLEELYCVFLKNYINIMQNNKDDQLCFYAFSNAINELYDYNNFILKKTNQLLKFYKSNISYSFNKFQIFFNYFYGDIPKQIFNTFQTFFCEQICLSSNNINNYYILLLNIKFVKNSFIFKIRYSSDDLIKKLRYSNEEFQNLNLQNLFAKTFYKSYKYTFSKMLYNGQNYLEMSLCLVDKNQYVILCDSIITPIFKKSGIEFFIKLKEAKEQLLINKNKNKKKKSIDKKNSLNMKNKNNKKKASVSNTNNNLNDKNSDNELDHVIGTCFLFTNKTGKIINLSRGFEEFFFLTSEVLLKYNINIMELFKLEKLDKVGKFEKNLFNIYDYIYEIFMREVGQIGEDPFSKVILSIKDLKNLNTSVNSKFIVKVNYEMKTISKDSQKVKQFFLFVINVKEEEYKKYQGNSFIFKAPTVNTQFETTLIESSYDNHVNALNFNTNKDNNIINNLNKVSQIKNIPQAINNIYHLASLILIKFFKQKLYTNKFINFNEEKQKTSNKENNLVVIKQKEENENKELLNNKIKNKEDILIPKSKYNILLKIFSYINTFIFLIAFIIIFIIQINKIIHLKIYLISSNDLIMMYQCIIQILLKVLLMQVKSNKLQEDYIDNYYPNYFQFHKEQLILRTNDYLYFHSRFMNFFNPELAGNDVSNYGAFRELLYYIPYLNGSKITVNMTNIVSNIQVILMMISTKNECVIYYNNTEYFFNSTMIEESEYSRIEYYQTAFAYVQLIGNLPLYIPYVFTEIILILRNLVNKKINDQYNISIVNLIFCAGFLIYVFIKFMLFLTKTNLLFEKYFYVHTQLRFFNNYLLYKSILILKYIDNYSIHSKIVKNLRAIEIMESNQELDLINAIKNDIIYDKNLIRISPYNILNVEKSNPREFENSFIQNENENENNSLSNNVKKIMNTNKILNLMANKATPMFKRNMLGRKSVNFGNINIVKSAKDLIFISNNFNSNNSNQNNKFLFLRQHTNNTNNTSFNSNFFNNYSNASSTKNLEIVNNNFNNSLNKNNISNYTTKSNANLISSTGRSDLGLLNINNINNNSINSYSSSTNNNNATHNNENNNIISPRKKNTKMKEKKTENKEEKKVLNNSGHKILFKPILYFCFLIELLICLILFMLIAGVRIFISKYNINMLKEIAKNRDDIFGIFNYITQILIDYEFSLLYNKELIINYTNINNAISCTEMDDGKIERYVFQDLNKCFSNLYHSGEQIISGKLNKNLKLFRKYFLSINENDFCKNHANFFIEYRNKKKTPQLSYLNLTTYDTLYNECYYLGGGLNKKGVMTAISSIFDNLITYNNEFVNDHNKTEEKNLKRFNDNYILGVQVEVSRIFRKITLCLYIAFLYDFDDIRKNILMKEIILFIIQIILVIFLLFVYNININKFYKDIERIEFFSDCMINTLLFK